jgi:hypothetical protein
VANKGVAGYGTWKRIRNLGDKGECWRERVGELNSEAQSVQRGRFRGVLAGLLTIDHDPWYHELHHMSSNIIVLVIGELASFVRKILQGEENKVVERTGGGRRN